MEFIMSISLFSVVIILIFAAVAAIEIYRGITRGFFHTLISLGMLIPCILIALTVSPVISREIVSFVFINVIKPMYFYQYYASQIPSLGPIVQAIGQAVVNLVLFVVCFALLRPVCRFLVFSQTMDKLSPDEDDPGYSRGKDSFIYRHNALLGGITGGVCAVIISMVITCPIMGALHVADDIIDVAEEFYPDLWSLTTLTEEDVDDLKRCPDDLPGNLLYEFGGEYLFHAAAKTEIYGETVYLHNELETIEKTFSHLMQATEILKNPADATPEDIAHLESVRDGVMELELCHGILADYFSYCALAWQQDLAYYSFSRPEMHRVVEPFLNEVLTVCSESTHLTVKANICTLLNSYIIILDSQITSVNTDNYIALLACLEESDLIARLDAELAKNPNMSHIRISSLGIQLLGDALNSYSFSGARFDEFCESIAGALNTVHNRGYGSMEERVAVLSTYLDKYSGELGVALPDTVFQALASELVYSTRYISPIVTTESIQEFFQQYQ